MINLDYSSDLFKGIKQYLFDYCMNERTDQLPFNYEWFLSTLDEYELIEIESMYDEIEEWKEDDRIGGLFCS